MERGGRLDSFRVPFDSICSSLSHGSVQNKNASIPSRRGQLDSFRVSFDSIFSSLSHGSVLSIAPSLIPRLFNSNPRHLNSDPRLSNSDPRLSTQNHISPHEPIIIIRFAPNSKLRNPPKSKTILYHYYYNYY